MMRRLVLLSILIVGSIAGLGIAMLHHLQPQSVQTLAPENMTPIGGHAFSVMPSARPAWPWLFEIRPDIANPDSKTVTLEDGKRLAAPHALHQEIKDKGAGRYSHGGTVEASVLTFSASDNSDPRSNGRRYEIIAQPVLSAVGTALIAALPVFLLLLQRMLFPASRLIYGFAAITLIVFACFFFHRSIVGIDTTHYVHWLPEVPLGYALFLSAIKEAFGDLRWAAAIQITILVSACTFLAASLEDLTARHITGFVALLVLFGYTPIFLLGGTLFSEALFIPLIILNLGAAFYLIPEKKPAFALLLATTAALIMFIRPAGYFVALGIIFLLIAQRQRIGWTLKWMCLPFLTLLLATLLINVSVRGTTAPSQTGRVLFPHVAFLFEPAFVSDANKDFALIIEQILRPRVAEYNKTGDRAARVHYSMFDYNSRAHAMDAAIHKQCSEKTGSACSFEVREALYREFFLATIRHRPIEYLQLIADGLIEAWRGRIMDAHNSFTIGYVLEADSHSTRMKQIEFFRLPFSADDIRLYPRLVNEFPGQFADSLDAIRVFLRAQRWLICIIGIVTLLAIPIAMFARSRHWLALGYCGVVIHGSMLLTAAVTVFIPRYGVPVDPVILIAGVIMMDGLVSWAVGMARQGLSVVRFMAVR